MAQNKDKMMANVLVKFLKAHGKYNVGETAGFDRLVAEKFETEKVAKIVGDVKGAGRKVTLEVGTAEVQKMIDEASAEFEQKADVLLARTEELDAADASLKEREADLDAREQAVAKLENPVTDKDQDGGGKPPAQGKK
ncbi:hypothetical protein JI58_07965 [Marinosulfonomonas sp. PRT-SC04]|nr:hypothetical protein JI58_07965 [Marinosulfonomonas sp. PRT-SC04]